MAINTLNVASNGYLSGGFSSLAVASDGYLGYSAGGVRPAYMPDYRGRLLQDDNEIALILIELIKRGIFD